MNARQLAALDRLHPTREHGQLTRKEFVELAIREGRTAEKATFTGRHGRKSDHYTIGEYEATGTMVEYFQELGGEFEDKTKPKPEPKPAKPGPNPYLYTRQILH